MRLRDDERGDDLLNVTYFTLKGLIFPKHYKRRKIFKKLRDEEGIQRVKNQEKFRASTSPIFQPSPIQNM